MAVLDLGRKTFAGKIAVVGFVRRGGPVRSRGGRVESQLSKQEPRNVGLGENQIFLYIYMIYMEICIFCNYFNFVEPRLNVL